MTLWIFKLVAAPADDARWNGNGSPGEAVVRAKSAMDAREVAAQSSIVGAHLFRDSGLYRVVEMNYGDDFRIAGPRGLIIGIPP